jgi:hypothetical protein
MIVAVHSEKVWKRCRFWLALELMKNQSCPNNSASDPFVSKHQDAITGILHGFDRLWIRGTLRALYHSTTMETYLRVANVMWKDFKAYAVDLSSRIKASAVAQAQRLGRPFIYLPSSNTPKEQLAKTVAQRDQLQEGLIAVLACVEPCWTYFMRGSKEDKRLELKLQSGKCQHFYFYQFHPPLGFMHVRLQSWFPFLVQICINGREWLSRQMDERQMDYHRKENCFTWISHGAGAQRLMDQQLETQWAEVLNPILRENHPLSEEIRRPLKLSYYWSAQATEYATDIMFKDAQALAAIYPGLVHHAISSFSSPDVLRFLGRPVPASNMVRGNFTGEVQSDLKRRPEGVRVKHSVNGNSIKIYDKQGSVLRVETTINHPKDFRVYRTAENKPNDKKQWRILRKTLADLPRRAEISHRANQRYLHALAAVSGTIPLRQWAEAVCKPITREGRKHRALNPWSPEDAKLLEAVSHGEFAINGFRNRDLRSMLFTSKATQNHQRRRAAKITRRIGLLRAHGLVAKVPGTHRYVLTEKGRTTITALLAARNANVDQLTKMAA